MRLPAPNFFLVYLNQPTCNTTDRFSIKKIPHRIGINHSFLIAIAITAMIRIIAVIAIAIRKEWLIPILCGIFLMENLSVVLQVGWFKYTKKKFGAGRRIFKMSPLHHHYQKGGFHESKIVTRFWIVGIFLAVLTIVTLKIR